jgi:mannose-6-phosphate isomerase
MLATMPGPGDPSHAVTPPLLRPVRPVPVASLRPWAGTRLGDGVGELWLAGPDSPVIEEGPRPAPSDTETLGSLARRHGAAFVGRRGMALLGPRFPLLLKVIDAAGWLSLQVHPDDRLAGDLYGPDALGKTEAWVVLAAEPGARLVTGPREGTPEDELRAAIATGTLDRDRCADVEALPGDAFLVEAGTIHAIGAGTTVYEIEQPSDLTFRISDWGRAPTPSRPLHTAEALRAIVPEARVEPVGRGWALDGGRLDARPFRLEIVGPGTTRAPAGESLEAVTAVGGPVTLRGEGWEEALEELETVVVPALVDGYEVDPGPRARAFVGTIP